MHLSRLYIQNYRSIKALDLRFAKGKNIIIGRNNTGKSNIIKALDIVLGENSPTYQKSENITSNDFHTTKETHDGEITTHTAQELFLWCELTRDHDEPLNYDDIYNCYGYYVCLTSKGGTPLRLRATDLPEHHDDLFDYTEDDCPAKDYINPKLRHQKTFEQQLDNKYQFAFAIQAIKDDHDHITKDIRFLYRETPTHDWIMAFRAPIRTELLQSAIIPSFRDPQTQLRLTNWTWYGKLMQHLVKQHTNNDDLNTALEGVQAVADTIFTSVRDTITQSTLNVAFPGTSLSFQFTADTGTELYKNCHVYIDDGYKSPLTTKGSGIQSATIIGLFTYYTHHVNTTSAALLCIEEPEIYLHPHARRVISDRLDDFIGDRHQVILTTHSVEFIRSTNPYLNITLVQKDDQGTTARTVALTDYQDLLIDATQTELFFAEKVIVCEGNDEYLLRIIAQERYPGRLDTANISIVRAAGKDGISRLVTLIMTLGIPCYVLADFDYLLRDQSSDAKTHDAKPHQSIETLGTAFFEQPCICGTTGNKVFRKLQSYRAKVRGQDPHAYYTAKHVNTLLANFPSTPIVLAYLRAHGGGLLSGTIEDTIKDRGILENGKFTYESAIALQTLLSQGTRLDDLVNDTELQEFLDTVLEQ